MATAIEKTLGDVRSQTELLSKHMVQSSGGNFTLTSFPSSHDVDVAIEATAAEILGWFGSRGYDTDHAANWADLAKQYVAWYNALGAAYRLENAHTGAVFTAQAKSRADGYWRQYQKLQEDLDGGMSFVEIGIPRITSKTLQGSVTGTSLQEKQDSRADTDRQQPFFKRDQFADPTTPAKRPVDTTLT